MNTTSDRVTEVAAYLAQVRAALADLPDAARDQLIDDVPEHLAEVAASGPAPLRERLGPPEEFAAELRSAAGLGAAPPPAHADAFTGLASAARATNRNLGRLLGYPGLVEAGRAFAPGWWVLRGVIAVLAVTVVVLPDNRYQDILYGPAALRFAYWVVVVAGAVASLRIGQAVARAGVGVRAVSVAVSFAAVAIVLWDSPFTQLLWFLPF